MRWYLGLVIGLVACNGNESSEKNDLDADGFAAVSAGGDDCNDQDAAIFPGADEICDSLDNNCDGSIDESGGAWYADADADGFGDAATLASETCAGVTGAVQDSTDCNDQDETSYPGAAEICDGKDNNCNGTPDEDALPTTWYQDQDGDGFGDPITGVETCEPTEMMVLDNTDCNDSASDIFPGAPETCDGIDQDCNGTFDDNPADGSPYAPDADQDGYGDGNAVANFCSQPAGYTVDTTDCNDHDANVSPGSLERCDAANTDENCNGLIDDADPGVDQSTFQTWYLDLDADGYGTEAATTLTCAPPPGYGAYRDCDDSNASINPGQAEANDAIDNDCDLNIDEDFIRAGDVIISEVHRQARFGETSSNPDGAWFELYNASTQTIYLSGWYIVRTNAEVGTDTFQVDPADNIVIDPGQYIVFCKTDRYASSQNPASTMVCDSIWGDSTQPYNYTSQFRDNTFNPQRDDDDLQLWFGGDTTTGTLMDNVHWYYDATNGYWPRDAARSMNLDLATLTSTANDDILSWCSIPEEDAYLWYNDTADSAFEYGTPGAANYDCP